MTLSDLERPLGILRKSRPTYVLGASHANLNAAAKSPATENVQCSAYKVCVDIRRDSLERRRRIIEWLTSWYIYVLYRYAIANLSSSLAYRTCDTNTITVNA